jgi:hypothetical protein
MHAPSVHLALSLDQHSAINPDVSSFRSAADVIQRLLPYHVFQLPDEDLHTVLDGAPSTSASVKGKGKARAREWDLEESEESEEREAAGQWQLMHHPILIRQLICSNICSI